MDLRYSVTNEQWTNHTTNYKLNQRTASKAFIIPDFTFTHFLLAETNIMARDIF